MRIGRGLLLIAAGAILKWALTDHVNNVNLGTVGTILMVVGAVGLMLPLIMELLRRRPDVVRVSRRYVDAGPARRVLPNHLCGYP